MKHPRKTHRTLNGGHKTISTKEVRITKKLEPTRAERRERVWAEVKNLTLTASMAGEKKSYL